MLAVLQRQPFEPLAGRLACRVLGGQQPGLNRRGRADPVGSRQPIQSIQVRSARRVVVGSMLRRSRHGSGRRCCGRCVLGRPLLKVDLLVRVGQGCISELPDSRASLQRPLQVLLLGPSRISRKGPPPIQRRGREREPGGPGSSLLVFPCCSPPLAPSCSCSPCRNRRRPPTPRSLWPCCCGRFETGAARPRSHASRPPDGPTATTGTGAGEAGDQQGTWLGGR